MKQCMCAKQYPGSTPGRCNMAARDVFGGSLPSRNYSCSLLWLALFRQGNYGTILGLKLSLKIKETPNFYCGLPKVNAVVRSPLS